MRRDAWWGVVVVSLLTAASLPAAAGASKLIGGDGHGVGDGTRYRAADASREIMVNC